MLNWWREEKVSKENESQSQKRMKKKTKNKEKMLYNNMEMGHSLIPRIHIAEAIDNSIRLRTAQNQNKTLKVISNAMFHHCYLFFVFVQRHADNLALFKMGALVLAAILAASFILQDEFVVFRFRKTRNL